MPKYISDVIFYFSAFAVLGPFIIAWSKYKYLGTAFKVLTWHLSLATIFNSLAAILSFWKINNLPLLHIYTAVEFICLCLFFYYTLGSWLNKWLLAIMISIFLLIGILNAALYDGLFSFNTIPRSLECLTIIILCIAGYYSILTNIKSEKLNNNPVFWIITGLLIYFSGSLFLFMMSNYILPLNHKLNILVWVIHAMFSDNLYLFISIGLWKIKKT
jgi:hypothetical protein